MDDNTKAIVLALIAAIPSSIAAISSLRNGRKVSELKKKLENLANKNLAVAGGIEEKSESPSDWYRPPKLWDD